MKQSAHEYLVAMHERLGESLTPELVVKDARRPESPLFPLFDWDVEKAAEAHWHDVARSLIRNVRTVIVHEGRTIKAPYFVRDPALPHHQQGYTSVIKLRSDADLARDAVAEECIRAASAFRRAQEVAAAVGVDSELRDLLDETLALGQRVKAMA
jgi:hypothetical protein